MRAEIANASKKIELMNEEKTWSKVPQAATIRFAEHYLSQPRSVSKIPIPVPFGSFWFPSFKPAWNGDAHPPFIFWRVGNIPPCGASNATMSSLIAQKASSLESLNTMRMNKLAIQRSSNATMSSFLKWLHLVAFDTTRQSSLCAFATLNIFREASTSRSFFDIQRVISTAQKLRCAQ